MGSRRNGVEPALELGKSQLTLQLMSYLAVADLAIERRKKIEGNIGGLKLLRVGVSDVVQQRTKGCGRGGAIGPAPVARAVA